MDKSTTVNKQTIEQAIIDAVKNIKHWTRRELSLILTHNKFDRDNILIIPIGHSGFLVGNYAIRQVNNEWHMIYRYNDHELVFHNRNSAMFYAICQQSNRAVLANQIYKYDRDVGKFTIESERFRARIQQSKKKDTQQKQLYASRYQESVSKLRQARFLLEKTLKMAKY